MFYSRVEFLVHVLKETNEKAPNDLSLTSRFTFEIVFCLSVKQRENMTCISIFKGYFHVPPSSRDQRYLRIILIFAQCHLKKKKYVYVFTFLNIVYTWPSDLRMGQHLYAISNVLLQPHTSEIKPRCIFSYI